MAARVNIRRRQLAQVLLRMRRDASLTQEQVAAHLECSKGKVWQMETGRASVGTPELRMLFDLFEVPEEDRERLLDLARRARSRERVWWQAYDDQITDSFGRYLDLESVAAKLNFFAVALVPGLLQTAGYAEAQYAATLPKATATQMARLRLERQERVLGKPDFRLWAVIDEGVLHRLVGGASVMREQIDKLLEMNERDNVTVQVLPFAAGAHVGQVGAFTIMEFDDPEGAPVVYQETLVNDAFLETAADVNRYTLAYDQLRAAGLSPAESVAHMAEVRAALPD